MNSFYAVAWHLCSLSQPRGGRFFNFLRRGDMTIQSENDELESGKVETILWRAVDFVKIGKVSNWKIGEFENWKTGGVESGKLEKLETVKLEH